VRQPRESSAASRPPQGALALRRVDVVRTYLSLDDRAQLRPKPFADADARVVRHERCPVPVYRRLYREVGERWFWHDRLEWSDEELARHLAQPNVGVWELCVGDASAGYFELLRHDDGSVEIAYFGLTAEFTRAVEEAFAMGARRVWLHTCTLDSERALPSYKARGFQEYKTQHLEVEIEGTQVVAERLLDR
jgi:hypothetical protein